MKVGSFSGGGFYLPAIARSACTAELACGYTYDAVAGISAGAYTAACIAMVGVERTNAALSGLDMASAFSDMPMNKKGKLRLSAIWRMVTGRISLTNQDGRKLLSSIIDKEDYFSYRRYGIPCFVQAVSLRTGERMMWNLQESNSYQEMLDMVEASARIPSMTAPVMVRGELYWDGGNRDHIPTELLLRRLNGEVTELLEVYARPSDWKSINNTKNWSWHSALMRSLEIFSIEVSKNDEKMSEFLCTLGKIKRRVVYIPRILAHYYDISKELQAELLSIGTNNTIESFKQSS